MASLIPRRLRRVCGRDPSGGGGSRRHWDQKIDFLHDGSSSEASIKTPRERTDIEINHVVLTGLIAADPQRAKSRDGAPVTLLLVSVSQVDERNRRGSARCEIEVLDEIADPQRESLRAGSPILVSGEMTGAGEIWAKLICAGEES